MNDNLAGQLWFGAECLAAGSSIMNKESESESMRPLAKAVTGSADTPEWGKATACILLRASGRKG